MKLLSLEWMKQSSALTYPCPHCPRTFKLMGLRAHIWQVHEGGDPNRGYKDGTRHAWNRGRRSKSIDEILVKDREKPGNLRDLLLEIGRDYRCECCGQPPVHNGRSLTLQVDHIDGDNRNQERTNLRFLCPNCHSQTPTFGWKNRKRHGRQKVLETKKECVQETET